MKISSMRARKIGDSLGVNWGKVDFRQFTMGINVELEHRNVTHGDLKKTGKIALAHLDELPNYYTELRKMEAKGKRK